MAVPRQERTKAVIEAWKEYMRALETLPSWDQGGQFNPLMCKTEDDRGEIALRLAISEICGKPV